jgi:hypothetical protein
MKRIRTARLVAVWVAALSCLAVTPVAPQTLDPQSIIGEWGGRWVDPRDPGNTGSYFMTIKKIEGNKIFTRLHLVGRGSFEGDREATLSGNTLTIETRFNKAEFTIEGDQMRGTTRNLSTGFVSQEISLVKKK